MLSARGSPSRGVIVEAGDHRLTLSQCPVSWLRLFKGHILDLFHSVFKAHCFLLVIERVLLMPARNELAHGHLQIATRALFGTLRWPAGDTPRFWEAGLIIRQSDSGRGGMEVLAHHVTGGSCPAAGSSYRSLKWRLSSFPLIQASRYPAFPLANASERAGSFSEMPGGCRILASPGARSGKHSCLGGGGPFSEISHPYPSPGQQVELIQPRPQGCHMMRGQMGLERGFLVPSKLITINYYKAVELESLHFSLASPQNPG